MPNPGIARLALVGVLFAFCVTGCGPKVTPTKGIVTFNNKPLPRANVIYTPEEAGGKSATGFTDDSGAFELTTFTRHDGALPGAYKVTVFPAATAAEGPMGKGPGGAQEANAEATVKLPIPEIYTQHDKTPLRRRIPEDGIAKIELTGAP